MKIPLALGLLLLTTALNATPADPVVAWNDTIMTVAEAEDGLLTLKGVRTAAIMHIAMHDALNNVTPRFNTYAYNKPAKRADALTAAVTAAHTVAVHAYPDQQATFDELREKTLNGARRGRARKAGVALGSAVAEAVLREREGDDWNSQHEYQWHPMAPGVYAEFNEHSGTPEGFIFGAGWARAKPFVLPSQDHFRAPPPPAITTDEYTRAFNEVREAGRFQSMTRTPDQTHLALWWKDFAERSHNRLARELADKEQIGVFDTARLFALVNIAVFDAYVSVFENKFHYNHWRPYTAIRWAEHDGNSDTAADLTWDNTHRHTYAFPSYPSAHGTACTAAMTAFAEVFGDDYAFTMSTPAVDVAGPFSGKIAMWPPTRTFESFSEAGMECAMSRVYLGIHFRYDSEEGFALGKRIGNFITQHTLTARSPR